MSDKVFKPINSEIKNNTPSRGNSYMIKGNNVNLGNAVKLSPDKDNTSNHEESIDPIIEDGKIIGVLYQCQCGRKRRILFEYNK
ncbi:MAG: hypothetical protein K9M80_07440 [Candidatus Marinimicrobia bacterium]|nr:hypothetical protein [Candidatus Neomarinimicrobiota bacterium]